MKLKRVFTTIIGLIFALAIINVIIEDPGSIFIFGAFGYGIYLLINRKKFSSFSKKRKIISIVSIVIMLTIGSALASPTSNTNNTTKSNLLAKEETTEAGNDVDTETDTNVDTEDNAGIEDEDSNLDVNKDKTSKSTSSTSTTSSSSTSSQSSKSPIKYTVATVTRHVDGDTVYVRLENGQEYKVRMIGVNTPETKHPQKGVEYYGKEASNYTKSKLLGKTIYLEKDVSETDKYGRLLRYIWLEPPTKLTKEEIKTKMFNAILVANGYAQVATYPPDVKYQDYFLEFEREARSKNIGLWGKPEQGTSSAAKSSGGSGSSSNTGSNTGSNTKSNTTTSKSSSNTNNNKSNTSPAAPPTTSISNNRTVYWTPNGKSYHYSKDCRTLSRSKTILSGPLSQCPKSDPCDVCTY